MHGYLSSSLTTLQGGSLPSGTGVAAAPAKARVNRFTLAYGTETGNSKKLATTLAKTAKERGFQVKLVALDQYRLKDLPKESYFFLVVSTQGDGEPPAAALSFFSFIQQEDVKLDSLRYAILALGDSAYPLFCQAGIDADQYLTDRGGKRLLPVVKCDQVFDEEGAKWINDISAILENGGAADSMEPASAAKPASSGKEVYHGEIITNINLNDEPSAKETHHIEIRCEGEIDYQPGDAASFTPRNPESVVGRVLELLGATGEETATYRTFTGSLREIFSQKVGLIYLPERIIRKYAALVSQPIEGPRLNLDDLLKAHPLGKVGLPDLLEILEPITPRLYSIASSPTAHPEELHLTVARHTFPIDSGTLGEGLCSTFLNGLAEGGNIDFHIHKNLSFKLPAPDKDIIMVGPGTGIAPFRSFLFERDAQGANGRNWLFFGEQHFVTDFLYQTELQDFLKTGVLYRLDVAFSRDQEEKIYVQHRLAEHGEEIFKWLDSGATFYICGAKAPMSFDVEKMLLQIIQNHGGLDSEKAAEYLSRLSDEGRYLKDVY